MMSCCLSGGGLWTGVRGEVLTGEKQFICPSMYISSSISSFDKLRDCRVIEGNLKIVLFDHTTPSDFANLTFPHLVEITDFLLVFRVSGLQNIGRLFPNLAVIRGEELFQDYALVVYQMNSLSELDFQNLQSIERGAVRIQRNAHLCYADTIDWDLIATSGSEPKRKHETSVSPSTHLLLFCPLALDPRRLPLCLLSHCFCSTLCVSLCHSVSSFHCVVQMREEAA